MDVLPQNTKIKPPCIFPPTTLEGRERETSVSFLIKAKCVARGEERELSAVTREMLACGKLEVGPEYQVHHQEP